MALLKLRNGLVVVTTPTALVVDSPEKVTYKGVEFSKEDAKGQEIFFAVEPRKVDDYMEWKGSNGENGHGDGFDVVEVLSSDELENYLKK